MMRFLLYLCLIWTNLSASAVAQGLVAQSDNFILTSEAPIDARPLLADLERFRVAVLRDLDLDTDADDTPLRLSIIDDPETFEAISPGGITAALYLQSAIGNDIVVGYSSQPDHFLSRALEPAWLRLVLRHEVVHHILETRYPRKLPIWLGEGLAEYYSTFNPGADGLATFGGALPEQEKPPETGRWLPMRTVIESMAKYPDFRLSDSESPFRAQRLYYGQSWALAHFVMDQPNGLARVHRFVDGWTPSEDSEDSFERAFGLRYAPLENRVREEIIRDGGDRRRISGWPDAPKPARVTDAAAADLVANRLRLLLTHGRNSALTARRIAALQRDGLTPPSLALAESLRAWRLKDWDGSDAATDQRLRLDPTDALALKMKTKTAYGRVSEQQTNDVLWAEAEAAAIQALTLRPDDAELHLFRVAVSLPTTDRLSRGARASLDWLMDRDTHLRLPHLSMMMIPALIYENEFDHADAVLDSAARWTEQSSDKWVIERLRGNVASERAALE